MYKAYLNGRAEKDPSEFWYRGEIGFWFLHHSIGQEGAVIAVSLACQVAKVLELRHGESAGVENKGEEVVAEIPRRQYSSSELLTPT
jgi:hypothetical protein